MKYYIRHWYEDKRIHFKIWKYDETKLFKAIILPKYIGRTTRYLKRMLKWRMEF